MTMFDIATKYPDPSSVREPNNCSVAAAFVPATGSSHGEWKVAARYHSIVAGGVSLHRAAGFPAAGSGPPLA